MIPTNEEIVERLARAYRNWSQGRADLPSLPGDRNWIEGWALPVVNRLLIEARLEQHLVDCVECGHGPLAYRCLRARGIEHELAALKEGK
jgi:hypothetical protein